MRLPDLLGLVLGVRRSSIDKRQAVISEELSVAAQRVRAAVVNLNREASALIDGTLHPGAKDDEAGH